MTISTSPRRPELIRVLLVDDHALFREGLARLLDAEPDLEVVAQCASVAGGLSALSAKSVDLVLLDVDLGADRASGFLSGARASGFAGPILIVTAGLGDSEASRLVRQGVAGFFFKQDSPQMLARSIRTVMDGGVWIEHQHLATLVGTRPATAPSGRRALTTREREVLRGVFEGLANKEIGSRLQVSESAVKAVLQQLFQKTGVRTRSQLVRIILEQYRDDL